MKEISSYNDKKKLYNLILLIGSIQLLDNCMNTKDCFATSTTHEQRKEQLARKKSVSSPEHTLKIKSKAACHLKYLFTLKWILTFPSMLGSQRKKLKRNCLYSLHFTEIEHKSRTFKKTISNFPQSNNFRSGRSKIPITRAFCSRFFPIFITISLY